MTTSDSLREVWIETRNIFKPSRVCLWQTVVWKENFSCQKESVVLVLAILQGNEQEEEEENISAKFKWGHMKCLGIDQKKYTDNNI